MASREGLCVVSLYCLEQLGEAAMKPGALKFTQFCYDRQSPSKHVRRRPVKVLCESGCHPEGQDVDEIEYEM